MTRQHSLVLDGLVPLGRQWDDAAYVLIRAPVAIAVNSHYVFWVDSALGTVNQASIGGGAVNKVPVGGGTVYALATNQDNPAAIATDAKNVYWVNEGGSAIWKIAK